MKLVRLVFVSIALVVGPSWVCAADLSKIPRTIAKESTYKTKPKYCLLVFGPEAKTRVWVVLDGDVLYVDRNGNGDLTETGECVKPTGKGHYIRQPLLSNRRHQRRQNKT